jgi:ABC-2 type transport system permease protein
VRLIGSELLKAWTTPRTFLGILLAELAIIGFGTAGTVDSAASDSALPPMFEHDLISVDSIAVFFAVLLGVLLMTTEYRHGTISQTFLANPAREWVLGAKAIAAALIGAAFVVPALVVTLTIAEIWVGDRGLHIGGDELELVARLLLAAAVGALFGLSIGAALGRQLAAVILVLGWFIIVEPATGGLFPSTRHYLPGHGAIGGILGAGGSEFPSFGKALPVAGAYLLGLGTIAVIVTRRRDIT